MCLKLELWILAIKMRGKNFVFISAVFGLINFGCGKRPFCNNAEKTKGIITDEVNQICFPEVSSKQFLVDDDSTYKATFSKGCELKNIDFSRYTLLGQSITGACELKPTLEVVIKNGNSYCYRIEVKECGICKKFVEKYCWVTVPKLPTGWQVIYETKKK